MIVKLSQCNYESSAVVTGCLAVSLVTELGIQKTVHNATYYGQLAMNLLPTFRTGLIFVR